MLIVSRVNAVFVLALIMCFFAGCHPVRYYTTPQDNVYLLADYEDTLNQWTVHDEIHKRFISVADGHALYLSWEVRSAFITTVRDMMNPSPEYLQDQIDRNLHQFANGNEFYLGLYCYEKTWCNITGTDPVWYLTLSNDQGITVRPELIEEIQLRPEQGWMFLQDMMLGRKVFRIVFPKCALNSSPIISKETHFFELKCHSLLGTLQFKWHLEPVPENLD